ncbi:MAG: ABC transporter substrate-binding protein [Umezawaea sp.]
MGSMRIGILRTADDGPVKLAEHRGYFREQGLTVQVTEFQSGPEALTAVQGGSLDVALINYVSFIEAVDKGTVDGRVIAEAYQGTEDCLVLMVKPGSPIREPKDLVGRKIAIHAPHNINELLVRELLKLASQDPDSPQYTATKFPDMPAALDSGAIDAAVMVEPYISKARQDFGADARIKLVTGATAGIPLSGYVALTDYTTKNPAQVAAFQRAMSKANQAVETDRAALADVLPDLTGIPKESVSSLSLGTYPTSLSAERLQRVIDLMRTHGRITGNITAEAIIVPTPGG